MQDSKSLPESFYTPFLSDIAKARLPSPSTRQHGSNAERLTRWQFGVFFHSRLLLGLSPCSQASQTRRRSRLLPLVSLPNPLPLRTDMQPVRTSICRFPVQNLRLGCSMAQRAGWRRLSIGSMIYSAPYTGVSAERDGLLALGVDLRTCCPRWVWLILKVLLLILIGHRCAAEPRRCRACPVSGLRVSVAVFLLLNQVLILDRGVIPLFHSLKCEQIGMYSLCVSVSLIWP